MITKEDNRLTDKLSGKGRRTKKITHTINHNDKVARRPKRN